MLLGEPAAKNGFSAAILPGLPEVFHLCFVVFPFAVLPRLTVPALTGETLLVPSVVKDEADEEHNAQTTPDHEQDIDEKYSRCHDFSLR